MEHYGARVAALVDTQPSRDAALFLTHTGCFPGRSFTGDTACEEMRPALEDVLKRNDVNTIVVSAYWLHYVERFGTQPILDRLAETLKIIRANKKNAYVILDNPAGSEFNPADFPAGNRFTGLSYDPVRRTVPLDSRQQQLNKLVSDVAFANGAIVIDPTRSLCQAGQCLAARDNGDPVYMDSEHLRSSYVRRYASFIDQTLNPGK
jgi:hypothetical protein